MLPVIDVGPLVTGEGSAQPVADALRAACMDHGFFYVRGHGIPPALIEALEAAARAFFALPAEEKGRIAMARGGTAWRGFFPVGAELTSGLPDVKEGIYFGEELAPDHPRVARGIPLHGANLFPERPAELRDRVLEYMAALTRLGQQVMGGIALSLGLPQRFFEEGMCASPLTLFRLFHYPPMGEAPAGGMWSVGEHTDYGLLTLLWQDAQGGLEVKTREGWRPAPPLPGTFVCNLGDMLDRLTLGRYRSTPHRVRNPGDTGRLSMPFFFDPDFEARVTALPLGQGQGDDAVTRWDKASVHTFDGVYGDWIKAKVGRVFPELWGEVTRR